MSRLREETNHGFPFRGSGDEVLEIELSLEDERALPALQLENERGVCSPSCRKYVTLE